jgi:hypothetical protein
MRNARPVSDASRGDRRRHRVGGGDDDQVADHAEAGGDGDRHVLVGLGRIGAWQDADRLSAATSCAARGRTHDPAQAARDDGRTAARQLHADLLRPFEDAVGVRAARIAVADDRDVGRPHGGRGLRHRRALPA